MSFYGAHIEGWALYVERLVEMGDTTMTRRGHNGRLHEHLLRAVRLGVDTGLHSKRWTRAQDAQYFAETLGDPESAASTEVELLRMTGTGQWRTYPDFPSTRGFHRIGAYTTT